MTYLTEKKERLEKVRAEINAAARRSGRKISDIKLIAVSKTKPLSDIEDFLRLGVRSFGENYVQEALEKIAALDHRALGLSSAPEWHFIGALQSNKAKFIPGNFTLVHGVDSERLAAKLQKAACERNLPISILIEVNIDLEASKNGILPENLSTLLTNVSTYSHIRVEGLMCIPDPSQDSRRAFVALRELCNHMNSMGVYPHVLTELSMGMSHDYAVAIEEGATMVRVGTALFGAREI